MVFIACSQFHWSIKVNILSLSILETRSQKRIASSPKHKNWLLDQLQEFVCAAFAPSIAFASSLSFYMLLQANSCGPSSLPTQTPLSCEKQGDRSSEGRNASDMSYSSGPWHHTGFVVQLLLPYPSELTKLLAPFWYPPPRHFWLLKPEVAVWNNIHTQWRPVLHAPNLVISTGETRMIWETGEQCRNIHEGRIPLLLTSPSQLLIATEAPGMPETPPVKMHSCCRGSRKTSWKSSCHSVKAPGDISRQLGLSQRCSSFPRTVTLK